MAAMAAAWRLSEPGWEAELGSITVYQRGWRLGGKGASSRGLHGRIEEHGLHLWLGYYENAFRLCARCTPSSTASDTDPGRADPHVARGDAAHRRRSASRTATPTGWHHWVGLFTPNDELPGEPDATGREVTIVDLAEPWPSDSSPTSSPRSPPRSPCATGGSHCRAPRQHRILGATWPTASRSSSPPASSKPSAALHVAAQQADQDLDGAVAALDRSLAAVREALPLAVEGDADLRRTWHLVSVMTASVRGVLADGLLTDPRGFHAIDDEDFLDWITRHGAAPEVADFAFIRGLYDLVFADGGADRSHDGVSAGVAAFMTSKMFFEYKGAIFWKMAAGMGDIVFAPMYEALRRRGVRFELFHRVDHLHLSADRTQRRRHHHRPPGAPRRRRGALRPARPRAAASRCSRPLRSPTSCAGADGIEDEPLESHWCRWPDAEVRTLRRGVDFDVVVLAIPVAMAELVRQELVDDRPEWKAMVDRPVDDRHAGGPALVARGRASARLAPPGRHRERLRAAVQHLGVDGPAHRRGAMAGR